MQPYGLHWFRRDLRRENNPALLWNLHKNSGRVLGIFTFDKRFLSRPDFSITRFQFFLETLRSLQLDLRAHGGDLICLDVGPAEAFGFLFDQISKKGLSLPHCITWNRDYEPFARERDKTMSDFFKEKGIETHTERDHLLLEPWELSKDDKENSGYQVFTPFSKKWLSLSESKEIQSRIVSKLETDSKNTSLKCKWDEFSLSNSDCLEKYRTENSKKNKISLPKAGHEAGISCIEKFKSKLADYGVQRDYPAINGTSHFSIYLKNGSLTTAEIIGRLNLKPGKFLNELIWREFYYHILWRYPQVETRAFQKKYEDIPWENRQDWFEAWKNGQTGFPIVDAGMKQLNQTGWMHNRVRMIVASFLTKDLLIDWRWGERYFMEKLIDGDIAPNNGGWQWAASTGCDAQPYFRVFNPTLQSQKFDPNGDYIKTYLPELSHLDSKTIHDPAPIERRDYPQPLVDHDSRRKRAIAVYKK